jgi:hypothetical protein
VFPVKYKLLLFLSCAAVVFGSGAPREAENVTPPNTKVPLSITSQAARTSLDFIPFEPEGSKLPLWTFRVRSSRDGNDYRGAMVKLRVLLARLLASHSVATNNKVNPTGGAECLYRISAHTLKCVSNTNYQMPPIIVGPENVASGDGTCKDNPQCTGREYKRRGPIEPGEYKMNPDARRGHSERFELEPIPVNPGWRVRLPSWMPGSLRGGFLLGLGDATHGCITVLKEDPIAKAQYEKMLQFLQAQGGNNYLRVVP